MRMYGEILSPISEKQHQDSTEDCPVGDGTYTVKMGLNKFNCELLARYLL